MRLRGSAALSASLRGALATKQSMGPQARLDRFVARAPRDDSVVVSRETTTPLPPASALPAADTPPKSPAPPASGRRDGSPARPCAAARLQACCALRWTAP